MLFSTHENNLSQLHNFFQSFSHFVIFPSVCSSFVIAASFLSRIAPAYSWCLFIHNFSLLIRKIFTTSFNHSAILPVSPLVQILCCLFLFLTESNTISLSKHKLASRRSCEAHSCVSLPSPGESRLCTLAITLLAYFTSTNINFRRVHVCIRVNGWGCFFLHNLTLVIVDGHGGNVSLTFEAQRGVKKKMYMLINARKVIVKDAFL